MLEPLDARQQRARRGARGGPRGRDQGDLERQARVGAVADVAQRRREQVDRAQRLGRGQRLGLPLQLGAAVGRRGLGLRQHLGVLQQVDQAQVAEQRVEQAVHVLPALGERVDAAQQLARLALRDEVDEVDEGLLGHEAEQAHGILDGDRAVAGRRELVEDRERVAVGAGARARDEVQHGVGRLDPLGLAHAREHLHELARPGPPEREALAARADRAQELGGIGRAEHEHDVRRRLLERLQERVRGVGRERVRLVQDVDLVASSRPAAARRARESRGCRRCRGARRRPSRSRRARSHRGCAGRSGTCRRAPRSGRARS